VPKAKLAGVGIVALAVTWGMLRLLEPRSGFVAQVAEPGRAQGPRRSPPGGAELVPALRNPDPEAASLGVDVEHPAESDESVEEPRVGGGEGADGEAAPESRPAAVGTLRWPIVLPRACSVHEYELVLRADGGGGSSFHSTAVQDIECALHEGEYEVTLRWSGCQHDLTDPGPVSILADRTTVLDPLDLELVLQRARIRVVTPEGAPLAGATVASRYGYHLADLDGNVDLLVCRQGHDHPVNVSALGFRPVDLPNAEDGRTVLLQRGIPIVLEVDPGEGQGALRVVVRPLGKESSLPPARFDATGRVALCLPGPGAYEVRLVFPDSARLGARQRIEVEEAEGQVFRVHRRREILVTLDIGPFDEPELEVWAIVTRAEAPDEIVAHSNIRPAGRGEIELPGAGDYDVRLFVRNSGEPGPAQRFRVAAGDDGKVVPVQRTW